MKEYKYKLLTYHMQNVNSDYLFGHAIVAGKLASKEIQTLHQYKSVCSEYGVASYTGAWKEWQEDMYYPDSINECKS